MKTKFLATAAVSAALLTGGVAVAATTVLPAYAQSGTTSEVQGQSATGQGQQAKHPRLREAAKAGIKTAADTIGIAPKDLVTELRSGKSIADVAREHNVDPQKVIDAFVTKADARIDKAVQNGKLDQAKADTLKAKVPDIAARVVNKTRGQHQGTGAAAPSAGGTPSGSSAPSTAAPSTSAPAPSTSDAPGTQLGGDTTTAPSGSLTGG